MYKYKKYGILLLILTILITSILTNKQVEAKTLGDLKTELQNAKDEYAKTKQEQQQTENKMTSINSSIKKAQSDMEQTSLDIEQINKDIEKLNEEIELKEEEIKKIINFYEISNGDSAYLEYVFGANDFTDMIYRSAVVEQLSKYNEELVKKFNGQIEENKKKQEELRQKQEELKQKQAALEKEYSSLGSRLEDLVDIKVDEEEAIKVQEEIINMYVKKGCKDNEDISTCGKKVLPIDTKLWRPLDSGRISSNFGWRSYNGGDYHTGIDIARSSGSPVYSTANGTVAALTYKYHCGGNMIFIHHNINGTHYTSVYMHLQSINVSKGDTVTKNTVIGYVGGGSSTPWDSCTTGPHLHFTLLSGLVGTDYRAWSSTFYSKLLNPRSYVNFPALGKSFEDRISAY